MSTWKTKLYGEIAAWAEDDFRSVNGQIEYLLSECVRQRKKNGKYVSEELDKSLDIEIEKICPQGPNRNLHLLRVIA